MEFGYTIPLQKRMGEKGLAYGTQRDLLFCWDLHGIFLRGQEALLAVNCKNRYTVVLFGLAEQKKEELPAFAARGIRAALRADGLDAESYFSRARDAEKTRTHGRREVAFLNRAWEDVLACDLAAMPESVDQFPLNRAVNSIPCRCAGHEGKEPSAARMKRDFAALLQNEAAEKEKKP